MSDKLKIDGIIPTTGEVIVVQSFMGVNPMTEFERLSKLRVGQLIKITKELPNYRNHVDVPKGAFVEYIGHKFDPNYKIIRYNGLQEVVLLGSNEWEELPDSDDADTLTTLYK
jgi:hypothetical protein